MRKEITVFCVTNIDGIQSHLGENDQIIIAYPTLKTSESLEFLIMVMIRSLPLSSAIAFLLFDKKYQSLLNVGFKLNANIQCSLIFLQRYFDG